MAQIIHKMVIDQIKRSLYLFFSDTDLSVPEGLPTTELLIVYSIAQLQAVYNLAPSVFVYVPNGYDQFKQGLVENDLIPLTSECPVDYISGPAAEMVAQGILLVRERAEEKAKALEVGVIHGFMSTGVGNDDGSIPMLLLVCTNEESVPVEVLVVFSIEQLGELFTSKPVREVLQNFPDQEWALKPEELFKRIAKKKLLPVQSSETVAKTKGAFMRFFLALLNKAWEADKADEGTPPESPATPSGEKPN